jgi:hypothetical protein
MPWCTVKVRRHTVTINGTASDFVVIYLNGNSGNKLDGALTAHRRHRPVAPS